MSLFKNEEENRLSKVSESITLRFEKTILGELRAESKQRMESTNALLNQIVKSYVKWHKPAKNAGLIHINKFLYKDMVEHLPDETLKMIASDYAQKYFTDITEMFNSTSSVYSYIEYLLKWIQMSGFNYRIDEENTDYLILKIQLDLGLKFSKFIGFKISSILESLDKRHKANVEVTEHLVKVQIPR
ncbi:hypothetical protein YTPLAS21_13220 [Candidatus Nitrosocosmicus sp.]|nr:hypothetical protein YTPLAS21_13220 [Candidatus Nitrosocosmicus sp.]